VLKQVKAIYSRWLVVHALRIILFVVRPLLAHLAAVALHSWDLEFLILGLTQSLDVSQNVPADTALAIRYGVRPHVAANVAVEGGIDGEEG
jgi:hypothetical protein